MQITSLKILNFRNYESLTLTFNPQKNIIYGKNGSGKTNIVEAIYMLGITKTFRFIKDEVVIKKGKNIAKIEGNIKKDIINNYKIIISQTGKRIKINNNKILKISDYLAHINIVLFHPDDLKLIKDTPSIRRKILNIEISSVDNEYLLFLTNYTKILKQRNSYLKALNKKNRFSDEYLEILTDQLIKTGIKLTQKRADFINNINKYITDIYYKITQKGQLKIKYKGEFCQKNYETLKKIFQKNISREIFLGKTMFGPHLDDLEFIIDNEIVKEFSSVGEQKNSIIAFKLAEIKNIEANFNQQPILILDDLFSELDSEKINNILALIDENIQTFITTTDIKNINQKLLTAAKIFYVENGTVKEE